jgi:hypothetical protein
MKKFVILYLFAAPALAQNVSVTQEIIREETTTTTIITSRGETVEQTGSLIVYNCNGKNCNKPK